MNTLMRLAVALCTAGLAGVVVPGVAQAQTLTVRDPQVCCARIDSAGNPTFFYAPKSQCTKPFKVVADERCRPTSDPRVCCVRTDAAGNEYPFYAPKSQCLKPLKIVPLERCQPTSDRRICCRTPNGFFMMPASSCKGPGTAPAHPDRCKQTPPDRRVCCKTRSGFSWELASKCRRPVGAPVNPRYCQKPPDRRVCCKTRRGFSVELASKCQPPVGRPVNARYCQPQRICCRIKVPGAPVRHILTDPRTCKRRHGQQVPTRYCRRVLNPTLRSPG